MKVLIVEDQPDMALLLSKIIADYGCEVNIANQAYEALDQLHEGGGVDLALVDWRMPVMSGIDLVKELRSRAELKQLKIIMMTAMNELEFVDEALNAGANEYLMKPFSREMVLDKMRACGFPVEQKK